MSHVRVDSSVPRHHKFLKAGPAPSWLWLCGLAYCQEGLTDGFIPEQAIDSLGVLKNARRLAEHLIAAGLWEKVDGGWQVHDYLEHNRSALEVNGLKKERRVSGRKGGVASGQSRRSTDVKQVASPNEANVEACVEPICTVVVDVPAPVVVSKKEKERVATIDDEPPYDLWFHQLAQSYPKNRVTSGHITQIAFLREFEKDAREDKAAVWADMLAGLENQKAGHEWRVKGMVPRLEKWLTDGLWRQRHEVAPVSERVSEKTSRTMTSAAEFIKAGQRGA